MEFLNRVLTTQLVVTLLAALQATVLRSFELIPAEVWGDVINTCLLTFVGGGLLKDGLLAVVNKVTTTTSTESSTK